MSQKIILFDWDDTLFSKNEYKKRLSEDIAKVCNISAEDAWKLEEEYFESLDKSGDFRIDNFLQFISEKSKKKIDLSYFVTNNSDIYSGAVFPEVIHVLNQLKNDFILGIYSQGFSDLQKIKIELSGIKDYFDKKLIYINNDKLDSKFIEKIPNGATVIDDKKVVIETLASARPDLQLLWINRKDEEKLNTPKIRTIKNLDELLTI